jgi:FtsH-binding integral membrane protein
VRTFAFSVLIVGVIALSFLLSGNDHIWRATVLALLFAILVILDGRKV